MATSSILGGTHLPEAISGKDTGSLGPSDNSDTGSDAMGAYGEDEMYSDTDATGTGERATIGGGREIAGGDIMPDHIESMDGDEEAGADDGAGIDDLVSDDDVDDDIEGDTDSDEDSR